MREPTAPRSGMVTTEQAYIRNGELRCALTRRRLHDPRIAPDGFTYEARAIIAHLARVSSTSPVTGAPMRAAELGRDVTLSAALSSRRQRRALGECPLSLERSADPVLASDHRHYDLRPIQRAYERSPNSPFSRTPLDAAVYRHQLLRARLGLPPAEEPVLYLEEAPEVAMFSAIFHPDIEVQRYEVRALFQRLEPDVDPAGFMERERALDAGLDDAIHAPGTSAVQKYLSCLDHLSATLIGIQPELRALVAQGATARGGVGSEPRRMLEASEDLLGLWARRESDVRAHYGAGEAASSHPE